ncbi:hypothetical protein GGI12_001646 [Dipsacomyces acuminosporus]|nr:hypothetical protein GGI12_001646 [Dipsacomyces acuminosporus]
MNGTSDFAAAWGSVIEYLKSSPPGDTAHGGYTLDEHLDDSELNPSSAVVAGVPVLVGKDTPLGAARQRLFQTATDQSSRSQQAPTEIGAEVSSSDGDLEWAARQVSAMCNAKPPTFAGAPRVWQLPSADLARVCQEHLSLGGCDGPALAAFIDSVLSDSAVSLENQCLLLRCAARCEWFVSGEAIPAVVQSQLVALLQLHAQAITAGLLLPLLEEPEQVSVPTAAMLTKLVKSDMPINAAEQFLAGVIAIAHKHPSKLSDSIFQIMETLVAAIPAGKLTLAIGRSCVEMVQLVVPTNTRSKKLSILILHIVNKLGSSLSPSDLDQIALSASALETPLKKTIMSVATRKKGSR